MTSLSATSEQPAQHPQRWLGILGIGIALSPPILQGLLRPVLESTIAYPYDRLASLLIFWVAIVAVIAISVGMEGFSLSTFGIARWRGTLREKLVELILALVMSIVAAVVIIGSSGFLRGLLTDAPMPTFDPANLLPAWLLVFAWMTAAFAEEFLFRSYAIERLTALLGNQWLAGFITMTLFTALHLVGWDWIHVLTVVLPGSIVLTGVYLWRRSLLFVVIIHGVINAPLLLLPVLAPYLS